MVSVEKKLEAGNKSPAKAMILASDVCKSINGPPHPAVRRSAGPLRRFLVQPP